jgi:chlorite dismutase
LTGDLLDFSGLESATDLMFFIISEQLKEHNKNARNIVNTIILKGCKFISFMSLYYLNSATDKNINNLSIEFKHKLRQRLAGCDRISESMIASLQFNNNSSSKDGNLFIQQFCIKI